MKKILTVTIEEDLLQAIKDAEDNVSAAVARLIRERYVSGTRRRLKHLLEKRAQIHKEIKILRGIVEKQDEADAELCSGCGAQKICRSQNPKKPRMGPGIKSRAWMEAWERRACRPEKIDEDAARLAMLKGNTKLPKGAKF